MITDNNCGSFSGTFKEEQINGVFCEFPAGSGLIAFNTVIERLLYLSAVICIYCTLSSLCLSIST